MSKQTHTFASFRETGRDVPDLRADPNLADRYWKGQIAPVPGRVYLDYLFIERRPPEGWPNGAAGEWYLATNGQAEWLTDDLEKLEALLYAFAVDEEYV